jgi:hypothetical protein
MPVSIPTLDTNSQEETISKLLAMFFFISYVDLYHGKDFLEDQRMKNIIISKRRRRKLPSMSCARDSLMSSRNSCYIADHLPSQETQTTSTFIVCGSNAKRDTISTQR